MRNPIKGLTSTKALGETELSLSWVLKESLWMKQGEGGKMELMWLQRKQSQVSQGHRRALVPHSSSNKLCALYPSLVADELGHESRPPCFQSSACFLVHKHMNE